MSDNTCISECMCYLTSFIALADVAIQEGQDYVILWLQDYILMHTHCLKDISGCQTSVGKKAHKKLRKRSNKS